MQHILLHGEPYCNPNHTNDQNDGAVIDLRHIMAGCNRSNGFSYLIYGYENKPENVATFAKYDDVRLGRKKEIDDLVVELTNKFDGVMNSILEKTKD